MLDTELSYYNNNNVLLFIFHRRYRDRDQQFSDRGPRVRGRQWGGGGKDGTPPNQREGDDDGGGGDWGSRERGQRREWRGVREGGRRDRGERRRRDDWGSPRNDDRLVVYAALYMHADIIEDCNSHLNLQLTLP